MLRIRLFIICLYVVFFLSGTVAVAESVPSYLQFSLKDCLKMATERNVKIKGDDFGILASEWRLNEAHARFKPVLEYQNRMAPAPKDATNVAEAFFSGDITYFNTFRLALGMPIHAFGQLATAQKLARHGVMAAKATREKDEGEIHYEVRRLFYAILLSRELKYLTHDALRKINNKLSREEEKGDLSPYKTAKLKIFKLDLEKKLDEVYAKEKVAREALRLQMGLEEGEPFGLKGALGLVRDRLQPLDYYLAAAKVDRPDSRLIQIGVRAKNLEYVLEKKKLMPQIGFGGFFEIGRTTGTIRNVTTTDDFSNPFNYTRAGVGLEVRGKIDFHGARARIKRLRNEFLKASTEGGLAKRGIALEVEKAYSEARRLRENIYRAEQKKKLARQMLFLSKSNLELGVGEDEEYADALQLVLEARGEYYKAVFEYNAGVALLDWKTGRDLL